MEHASVSGIPSPAGRLAAETIGMPADVGNPDVALSIYAVRVHSKGPYKGRAEKLEPYINSDGVYTLAPRPKTELDRPGNRVLTPDLGEVARLLRTKAYCLVMRGKSKKKNHMVQPYDITIEGATT